MFGSWQYASLEEKCLFAFIDSVLSKIGNYCHLLERAQVVQTQVGCNDDLNECFLKIFACNDSSL